MAVVTIIREIVRAGIRINKRYKYLNINDKFIRKYVPPGYRTRATRFARAGELIGIGVPIYNAIEQHFRDGKKQIPGKYNKFKQTRNYMEQSSSRRFKRRYCKPRYRNTTQRY